MNDYYREMFKQVGRYPKITYVGGFDFASALAAKPEPKKFEGGETVTDVRFAVRVSDPNAGRHEGTYVQAVEAYDGGFTRGGTLQQAYLFNTADDAAKAIARRNANHPSRSPSQYVIVPVTLTTVTAKYELVTEQAPDRTVYEVHFGGHPMISLGQFFTADDAAEALADRANGVGYPVTRYSIVPVIKKGKKNTHRKLVTQASTTRSL